jgi:hypothetical protein
MSVGDRMDSSTRVPVCQVRMGACSNIAWLFEDPSSLATCPLLGAPPGVASGGSDTCRAEASG